MPNLDDIDLEILRLLAEDARRPYSDIATEIDRSPPTVADRIDRLVEVGIIRRFTVDVDRTMLEAGVSVLVEVDTKPGHADVIRESLETEPEVEHVFVTANGRIILKAIIPQAGIEPFLKSAMDMTHVRKYEVHLLTDVRWTPRIEPTAFALDCAECGNTVTDEGSMTRIGDKRYHFCCSSCLGNFRDRYERIQANIE